MIVRRNTFCNIFHKNWFWRNVTVEVLRTHFILIHAFYFQTYVADIFLAQSWRDQRLRLPENMSEEYRILDVEWLHEIWRPDCFFKNAKKVTFHEMSIPNHYLWLYHDKTLLYMSKYEYRCRENVNAYKVRQIPVWKKSRIPDKH